MFADKLQNPFLKPSPFTTSPYVPSYTSSYNAPPLPPSYKYNSYKTYEQPTSTAYRPTSYQTSNAYNFRENQSKDIDTMLINNPFNRKSSNFGGSRASDLSPKKYSNQTSSYIKPKIHNNYENYQYTPQNYEFSSAQQKTYRDTQRLTPPKKYDNYLSTSSADSAATYINKITDFQQDKASVYDAKPLPQNPFYRKNLLQKTTQPERIPTKDYESSAALKYMSYKMQSRREAPPLKIDQNSYQTYIEDDFQNRGIDYKNNYQTTFSRDKNLNYEEQKSAKFGTRENDYKYTFKKEDVPVYDYETYDSKLQSNKYDKYDYKQQSYDKYNVPSSYQALEKLQNYPYDSNKMSQKYLKNINEDKMESYNYNSYQDEPRFGSKKDSYKQQNTYEEPRVRFDQDQEAQSSKFKSYKGIESNFDTLGANPYLAYTGQSKPPVKMQNPPSYEYEKNYMQPYKLASSQVDEYTGPQQMQKKIKQNKYEQLGLERQPQNYRKKTSSPPHKAEIEDSGYNKPLKSGAPIRDSRQYPKVLEYRGVLFHKIEVM